MSGPHQPSVTLGNCRVCGAILATPPGGIPWTVCLKCEAPPSLAEIQAIAQRPVTRKEREQIDRILDATSSDVLDSIPHAEDGDEPFKS